MRISTLKVDQFLYMINYLVVNNMVDDVNKKCSRWTSNGPGWLYDPKRKDFLKPASYEQFEIFKKQGFITEGPAGGEQIQYIIKQREDEKECICLLCRLRRKSV